MSQTDRPGDDWVTVATNLQAYQAEILKLELEAADIPVQIRDGIVSTIMPFERIAMEGARLLVPPSFAEQAVKILDAKTEPQPVYQDEASPDPSLSNTKLWYKILFKASFVFTTTVGLGLSTYVDLDRQTSVYPFIALGGLLILAMVRSIYLDMQKFKQS